MIKIIYFLPTCTRHSYYNSPRQKVGRQEHKLGYTCSMNLLVSDTRLHFCHQSRCRFGDEKNQNKRRCKNLLKVIIQYISVCEHAHACLFVCVCNICGKQEL